MMTTDRLLSALAMCRGAGKLAIGFDAAAAAARAGAPLVVTASDIADRTRRNIARCCDRRTLLLEMGRAQSEIEAVVGRKFVVAAVQDVHFARLIEQHIRNSRP